MKNLLIAGIAAIAAVGSPALAADMPIKAPPPPVVAAYDWTGFYVGVEGGVAHSRVGVENPAFPAFGQQFGVNSGLFGGIAGAQVQFNRVVLGVEANWAGLFGDGDAKPTCGTAPVLVPGGASNCRAGARDIWTVGGRAGLAMMDRWMPYIAGGYAGTTERFEAFSIPAGVLVETARARLNGWYIGGGIDVAVYQNWIFGLEYRHYDFRTKDVNGTTPAGVFLETVRFDSSADTFTARLAYKFNWFGPVRAAY
jgi:outer membrane immunogenic protein